MEAADLTCRALDRARGRPDSLHRFIVGVDQESVELDQAAIERLNDPFAERLLARGVFPDTPEKLLEELTAASEPGDPLSVQRSFVVGEGSQLPAGTPGAGIRGFIVTRGEGPEGPDLIVSAPSPDDNFIEVMAWDRSSGGFNYYQTRQADSPWLLAGNSVDAFRPGAAGHGPFESHPSGNFVMKELRFPWVHWHSSAATIRADGVPAQLAGHRWFTERRGAQDLEVAAAMPAIRRWTRTRLEMAVAADGTVGDTRHILRSFLATPTVNLISSRAQAGRVLGGGVEDFEVPHAFFVDSECLHEILRLPAPDPNQLRVSASDYRRILTEHQVTLRFRGQAILEPPQDTHFVFVVPERAFEDIETVRGAIEMGLVSERLAACLLMVDFANPLFSARRESLLAHVPDSATIANGQSSFSEDLADSILNSSEAEAEGTPEHEFSQRWGIGEEWPAQFAELLTSYYEAIPAQLQDADGLEQVFRLAESRRERVRDMPIHENPFLFATPDPPIDDDLRMLPTGEIIRTGS